MDTDPQLSDIVYRIKAQYDDLSKSQKKITDFILAMGADASYMPAARIAALVGVDRSTVVRTVQALGYGGFRDFQAALQQELLMPTRMADRLLQCSLQLSQSLSEHKTENGKPSILYEIVQYQIARLGNMLNQIQAEEFDEAVEWLEQARTVFILGLHSGSPVASMFGNMLHRVRSGVVIIDKHPKESNLHQLEEMSDEDVLFVISGNPHARETIRYMEFAQSCQTFIILVTLSPWSHPVMRADLTLTIWYPQSLPGYSLELFALLNALFATLTVQYPENIKKRSSRLDTINDFFDVYDRGLKSNKGT
jgi:DNA-binding MurR/RpiR family transcriptional regulator